MRQGLPSRPHTCYNMRAPSGTPGSCHCRARSPTSSPTDPQPHTPAQVHARCMSLESALPEVLPPQPPSRMQSADLDQLGRRKAASSAPQSSDLLQRTESADLPAGVGLKSPASWDLRGHAGSIKARCVRLGGSCPSLMSVASGARSCTQQLVVPASQPASRRSVTSRTQDDGGAGLRQLLPHCHRLLTLYACHSLVTDRVCSLCCDMLKRTTLKSCLCAGHRASGQHPHSGLWPVP